MANETYKGIEVSGIIYDNEDETARSGVSANSTSIGTLSNLETEEKTNLVDSINEVLSSIKDFSLAKFTPDSITADTSHAVDFYYDTTKFTEVANLKIGIIINGASYQEAVLSADTTQAYNAVTYAMGVTSIVPLSIYYKPSEGKIRIVLKEGITSIAVFLLSSNVEPSLFNIACNTYSYAGEAPFQVAGTLPSSGIMVGTNSYHASGNLLSIYKPNWNVKLLIMFDDGDYVFFTANTASGDFMAYARSGSESVSGDTLLEFHGITVTSHTGGAFRSLNLTKAGQVIRFV